MTVDTWSIYLEIISFFLVSIDLYGKERLSKTSDRLLTISEKLDKLIDKIRSFRWTDKSNRILLWTISFLSIGMSVYLVSTEFDDNWAYLLMLMLVFVLLFFLAFTFSAIILIGLSVFLTWLIKGFIRGLVSSLVAINFDGLLLIVGAILFVVSKLILL